eukprot:g19091.t1
MCQDLLSTEEQDGHYVQTLTEKLPSLFGAKVADEEIPSRDQGRQQDLTGTESWSTVDAVGLRAGADLASAPSESTEESDPSDLSSTSNPGSVGHPELCRRPCIYFAAGQCRNSADCNFCHLSHTHRSATLDKNQRQLIKDRVEHSTGGRQEKTRRISDPECCDGLGRRPSTPHTSGPATAGPAEEGELNKHEFLSVLLRCLRNKAAQGSFQDEAQAVLQLFEERLSQEPEREEVSQAAAKINNFEKALNRMTFFSVASLITRAHFEQDFLDRCKAAVGQLRAHFD